ncbi:MAG: NADH-quinone oxidoreductase subunit L [Fimbriimonadaceae bacterium]
MDASDFSYVPWIVLTPLLGFLFQALLGKFVVGRLGVQSGRWVCGLVAVLAVFVPFLLGVAATMKLAEYTPATRAFMVTVGPWIDLASFKAPLEFYVDPLSMTMVLVVTGVGCLIHLYATGYMAKDADYPRFFTYMNLFIVAMLVLVLGGNLLLLFVGWEGVGLCSYLLIGFWYRDHANARAANKAFIFNRIGDFGFILGLFLLFCLMAGNSRAVPDGRFLSFDLVRVQLVNALAANPGYATAIALLLFVGACGKSAQFPLYSWLPDAMAGPTPVSALIHAATMVTAGVFLLNRLYPVFLASPVAGSVIAAVGAFTALFAALIAFGQTDIKKVLAFSTVSQLGFMFVACGAGAYSAGIFHVVTHAFFKALLFLGAGAVIHAMADNQDMRNYGGLRKYLPITFWTVMAGFFAIAGFPFLAGFISKEAILGAAIGQADQIVQLAGFVALFTAFLTALYMARLAGLTFFGAERWRTLPETAAHIAEELPMQMADEADPSGFYYTRAQVEERDAREAHDDHHVLEAGHVPHEASLSMTIPLILLAIPSLFLALVLSGPKLESWLYPPNLGPNLVGAHEVPWLPWVSGGAAIVGIAFGLAIYAKGLPANQGWDMSKWNPLRRLAGDQFHFDAGLVNGVSAGGRAVGLALSRGVDPYLVDGTVNATGYAAGAMGLVLRKLQSGYVRFYALVMLLGVLAVVGYLLFAAHGGANL